MRLESSGGLGGGGGGRARSTWACAAKCLRSSVWRGAAGVGRGVAFSMRKWTSDRRRALTVHAYIHEKMRVLTTLILLLFFILSWT